mmetsp:Transcript_22464/g.27458  ORF Transcript_22464/g.27458 Transcript_22464/m.27458 type:complete len:83 (+) Transcript_22464:1473-1721(+)
MLVVTVATTNNIIRIHPDFPNKRMLQADLSIGNVIQTEKKVFILPAWSLFHQKLLCRPAFPDLEIPTKLFYLLYSSNKYVFP